jgi:hypothetical protein
MANFVASQAHIVGPAVSYSIGQGATMISGCWGVFVWHEFRSSSSFKNQSEMDVYLLLVWLDGGRLCPALFIDNLSSLFLRRNHCPRKSQLSSSAASIQTWCGH